MNRSRYYLRQICATNYGAFSHRELGPLHPGLNVVFGLNEAGKSTYSSLVGDVLFGWDSTLSETTTQRLQKGVQDGTLVFASYAEADDTKQDGIKQDMTVRLTRRGDEPLDEASASGTSSQQRDTAPSLLSDIDLTAYHTMFSFSSDKLRSLDSANDVTARLLSAGSGTAVSPSSVYIELEQRIAALTSLSPEASDSVMVLAQHLEEKRAQVQEAAHRVEQLKQSNRELRELLSNRADANDHLNELDRSIEQLTKAYAELEDIDARLQQLQSEYEEVMREHERATKQAVQRAGENGIADADETVVISEAIGAGKTAVVGQAEGAGASTGASFNADTSTNSIASEGIDERLLELDATTTRRIRERLDEFEQLREKAQRVQDTAKENSVVSRASYEALVELDRENQTKGTTARSLRGKASRAAGTIVPGIVFFVAGIALFIYGRHIGSLSFTVLSLGLIALSFVLALAAAAGVKRKENDANSLENRIKDAQWIMLQDQKRLDSSRADLAELTHSINAFLDEVGLYQAQGSLRSARALLDEAHELRLQKTQDEQREAAIQLRLENLQHEMDKAAARRARIEESLQLQPAVPLSEVDELLQARIAQRSALRAVADESNHRIGQLSQELQTAASDTTFDDLKLDAEILRTRLREAKEQLAELLLARHLLERAMISWEGNSQPLVYEEASRLFSLITEGRWVGISSSSAGSIVAIDRNGTAVDPFQLSLGTCQQMYLALRVALLLTAQDLGQSIPVIADDIMAHFDEQRRVGAARVLAELARFRQVIVFTCHQETVAALREAASELVCELNCLTLDRL